MEQAVQLKYSHCTVEKHLTKRGCKQCGQSSQLSSRLVELCVSWRVKVSQNDDANNVFFLCNRSANATILSQGQTCHFKQATIWRTDRHNKVKLRLGWTWQYPTKACEMKILPEIKRQERITISNPGSLRLNLPAEAQRYRGLNTGWWRWWWRWVV